LKKASADKQKPVEVGAELFIGNLDPIVDEKTLYDTFSRFGTLQSQPKIARDESGLSKGYGFVSYTSFEASDDAIANMNGQYLMNKDISVQYAYKKDGKGERHGDEAERTLASQGQIHNVVPEVHQMPPQLLMNGVPQGPAAMVDGGFSTTIPVHMSGPPPGPPGPSQNFPPGFNGPPRGGYNNVPPPQQRQNAPLPPPPSGLPQRPPPSQAGYGGPPQGFEMHGQQGYAPPPQGFGQAMPPGFGGLPPGQMPPGFGNMPPPGPPGGYAPPPGYGRR
jgi:splicing factor 3B subunit 4